MDTLNATGNALLESLISTKEQLSDAAENFNSQNIFHDANTNLVLAVNATFSGAESVVDDLGVFESLDSIVQGAALTPLKINKIADVSSFFIDGSEPDQVPEIDLEIGMISFKMSYITFFGHKHKILNFIKKFEFFSLYLE